MRVVIICGIFMKSKRISKPVGLPKKKQDFMAAVNRLIDEKKVDELINRIEASEKIHSQRFTRHYEKWLIRCINKRRKLFTWRELSEKLAQSKQTVINNFAITHLVIYHHLFGQSWLIKAMQVFSLRGNENGVCNGVVHMFKYAFLLQKIDKNAVNEFIDRAYFINRYAMQGQEGLEKLKEEMEAAQKTITHPDIINTILNENPHLSVNDKTEILKIKMHKLKNEYRLLSILPFLIGIEIYYKPSWFTQLFEKDINLAFQNFEPLLELLSPILLSDSPYFVSYPGNYIDVGTEAALKDFLLAIEIVFQGINESCSIIFSCNGHATHIGYNIETGWSFFNPSRMQIQPLDLNKDLSLIFLAHHEKRNQMMFEARIFMLDTVNSNHTLPVKKALAFLQKQVIATFNASKANFIDIRGNIFLHRAIHANKPDFIRNIIKKNLVLDYNHQNHFKISPLYSAARNGRTTCVKALLIAPGIDVNFQEHDFKHTPLIAAIIRNHETITQMLITANGIDINLADEKGQTPLYWALHKSNNKIAKWLLAKPDINLDTLTDTKKSFFSKAIAKKNYEMINLLVQKYIMKEQKKLSSQGKTSKTIEKLTIEIMIINLSKQTNLKKCKQLIELLEQTLVQKMNARYTPGLFSDEKKISFSESAHIVKDLLYIFYSQPFSFLKKKADYQPISDKEKTTQWGRKICNNFVLNYQDNSVEPVSLVIENKPLQLR